MSREVDEAGRLVSDPVPDLPVGSWLGLTNEQREDLKALRKLYDMLLNYFPTDPASHQKLTKQTQQALSALLLLGWTPEAGIVGKTNEKL